MLEVAIQIAIRFIFYVSKILENRILLLYCFVSGHIF